MDGIVDRTGIDSPGCLSPHHIRSFNEPAKVQFHPDASYAKVTRQLTVKMCSRCGKEFRVETYRADRTSWCTTCKRGDVQWKRGEVTRFSESSRKRLMSTLNKVRKDCLPLFVTLTYSDEFAPYRLEPAKWKRDIRAFEHRFRRAFPDASYVWRLEIQDRKSGDFEGELFPHFHLLVFNCKLTELRAFTADNWYAIAGNGDENHLKVHQHRKTVTPVTSRRGVMKYASKTVGAVMSSELGKTLQAKGHHTGRWWGIICRNVFDRFLSRMEELQLWDKDAVTLIRYFRKIIGLKGYSLRSLSCFMDGEFMDRCLLHMLAPPGKWCYEITGRRYDVPFYEHMLNRQ